MNSLRSLAFGAASAMLLAGGAVAQTTPQTGAPQTTSPAPPGAYPGGAPTTPIPDGGTTSAPGSADTVGTTTDTTGANPTVTTADPAATDTTAPADPAATTETTKKRKKPR